MTKVLASFSISFIGEKSCKTDMKSRIIVSEHVYEAILPIGGKIFYLFEYITTR